MYGALAPKKQRLDIIMIDDSSKGLASRAKSRCDKKKDTEEQRERDIGNPNNPLKNDRLALATLSIQNHTLQNSEKIKLDYNEIS